MQVNNDSPICFDRLTLDNVLRADSDGMPIFRKCFAHEILLSFYDDSGKDAFQEWWNIVGKYSLANYCKNNEKYQWLIDDE